MIATPTYTIFKVSTLSMYTCTHMYISYTHSGYDSDEELGAICVWSCVSHAESVGSIVLQLRVELIFKLSSPY